VLLDADLSVKVSDVGDRRLKAFAEMVVGRRLFNAWSAPEVLKGRPARKASDVYSFGLLCYELLTRSPPSANWALFVDGGPKLPTSLSPEGPPLPLFFLRMVQQCVHRDPTLRPSFAEIVRMVSGGEEGTTASGSRPRGKEGIASASVFDPGEERAQMREKSLQNSTNHPGTGSGKSKQEAPKKLAKVRSKGSINSSPDTIAEGSSSSSELLHNRDRSDTWSQGTVELGQENEHD